MASMQEKAIAITGGASGIGLATAKILASRGAKVSICDVSKENLTKAKESIDGDVLACKVDVRILKEVQDWLKQTVDKFGSLDGAANLAGTIGKKFGQHAIDEEDEEMWDLIIGVNLTHGVVALTKTAAIDFGSRGIRINAVAPGIVDTPMLESATSFFGPGSFEGQTKTKPIQRMAQPQEVGNTIAFLLSDDASFITGSVYEVDGGWTAGG
ncbi:uncharacterized protein LTR77_009801 [Saxophila tyrrhenica]|uniref:Uncharacterized protein n=1 Tax=Saxophila tyrrhenica TaxID=1690608 RepID=A0AAV9P161_9PEZI|nr:hypothetical protein LTR77_009801 [Saxophila tyrrhenica]